MKPEELQQRLDEIRKRQSDLANDTEGSFKTEDMDALFFDGILSLVNDNLAKDQKARPELIQEMEKAIKGRLMSIESLAWHRQYDWSQKDKIVSEHLEYIKKDLLALFDETEIRKQEREKFLNDLAHIETLHLNYMPNESGNIHFRKSVMSLVKSLVEALKNMD